MSKIRLPKTYRSWDGKLKKIECLNEFEVRGLIHQRYRIAVLLTLDEVCQESRHDSASTFEAAKRHIYLEITSQRDRVLLALKAHAKHLGVDPRLNESSLYEEGTAILTGFTFKWYIAKQVIEQGKAMLALQMARCEVRENAKRLSRIKHTKRP